MAGRRRFIEERIMKIFMAAATACIICVLGLILYTIVRRGLPALSLEMVTSPPSGGYYLGKGGGILNAIVGSLLLASGASLLALCVSLPAVLCLNVYERHGSRFSAIVRFSLDVLWGVPSIVYGAFGFSLMLFFGLKASLLCGTIAVALLILPIMSRAMDEVVRMTPRELFDASYALGATRTQTAFIMVLRQAFPGIVTALLIAFGRGIGDAASVLFTAGFSDAIPGSPLRPAATLPLAIFFQLGSPFPEVQDRAYAAAFILTILVFAVSIGARIISKKYGKYTIK